mgnify:CR=1 FL=1
MFIKVLGKQWSEVEWCRSLTIFWFLLYCAGSHSSRQGETGECCKEYEKSFGEVYTDCHDRES